MNRLLIHTILCFGFLALSWTSKAQQQHAYRISFTDKKGAAADISLPAAFLSARALDRRNVQHLAIDSADLPVSKVYVDSVLKLTGGILHLRSRWLNYCVVLVSDTSDMQFVRGKSFVKDITYVAMFSSPLHLLPAAPFSTGDTAATAGVPGGSTMKTTSDVGYYGSAYDQINIANGQYLHNQGYRGSGKMIAVLDAGFAYVNTLAGFDSMRSGNRLADTYNFDLDTNDVFNYSTHGMEVLSTMAGIVNGAFVGTAPDALYALYLTEHNADEQPFEMDNLVAGLERADSIGADIASISLGYNFMSIGMINANLSFADIDGKTTVAARAANIATRKGMLIVSSAGNEGSNSWGKILTPGDADSALTIGSVDGLKNRSATSGKGPNSAGVLKPDVCMQGAPAAVLNTVGSVSSGSGTSLATPEMAGLAACLWQMFPKATPYQLRDAIRRSAHRADRPDTLYGYGVPDFGKAADLLKLVVDTTAPVLPDFTVGPSPFSGTFQLNIGAMGNTTAELSLVDVQGKLLLQRSLLLNAGANTFDVAMPGNAPSGIYILRIVSGGQMKVVKLVHRQP
jgi:hypothetical protein